MRRPFPPITHNPVPTGAPGTTGPTGAPNAQCDGLIVMRLADMHRVHPQQDNSRVCSRCGHQVGIYPSGQAVLREMARRGLGVEIICSVCAGPDAGMNVLAPGALTEPFESVAAKRGKPT